MTEKPDNRSGGGTLLLFIVIFLLFGWMLTRGACWSMGIHGDWPFYSIRSLFGMSVGLMTLLHFAMAFWVGIDANRRGMQGILWGCLVFFTSIVGLVVYLIVCSGALNSPNESASRVEAVPVTTPPPPTPTTPPTTGKECDACRSQLEPEFKVCPYCGEQQNRACAGCGKELRAGWKVCPYCGTSVEP
jgi:RNA polymerase subunit RPABC4/transcription elongation factor Spt4